MSAHASQSQSGAALPTDLSAASDGRRETKAAGTDGAGGRKSGRSGGSKRSGSRPSGAKGSKAGPGKRGKKRRRIPRGALVPLLGSLLFHMMLMAVMFITRPDPLRTRQLTDIEGFESMLSIPPPPMPDPEPAPEPIASEQQPAEPAPSNVDEFAAAANSAAVSPTFFNPLTQPRVATPSSTPVSRLPTRPKPKVEQPAKPAAPKSAGFGQVQAQRASKVVYAVDVSGAMVPVLPFLLQELRRSVERLDESQSFQVIFFRASDTQIPEPPSMGDQLLAASRNSKRTLDKIVTKVDPGGRSDPLSGLSRAIALKPDVVFLLSRNIRRTGTETQSGEDLLTQLDRLNPKSSRTGQRPVVIKTIQFIDDDPTGLMQAIAVDHGDGNGSYRVMSIADLKKQ
jgi:hypothetical protein